MKMERFNVLMTMMSSMRSGARKDIIGVYEPRYFHRARK